MTEKRFEAYDLIFLDGFIKDTLTKENIVEPIKLIHLLNEKQATINNQKQRIKILQQEIKDTQAVLEMQSEKLKGWNDE